MAEPRFLFVAGTRLAGFTLPQWPGTWAPLADNAGPDGPWVAWRLAGANNHELGRSAAVFTSFDECREAVVALRRHLDGASAAVAADLLTGAWAWQLQADGDVLAVSARCHRRQRECQENLERFVAAAHTARLPEVTLPKPLGVDGQSAARPSLSLVHSTSAAAAQVAGVGQ